MARRALLASAALYAGILGWSALVLPSRVPQHVDGGGRVDAYSSRGAALLAFGALGAGTLVFFLLLAELVRRVPLGMVNVPHAEHWKTPEREGELRRRIEQDLLGLAAGTLLMLAGMLAVVTYVAVRGHDRLPVVAWGLLAAYLVGTAGWLVWLSVRRYRP